MKFNLTRLAPTPSGNLLLGNLYSFLLTKALAEESGAEILLRIDDLDRERYRPEYVQDIFDTLDFMEIGFHQGPRNLKEFEQEWSQIHRMSAYQEALEKLRDQKLVFACDCSRKRISQLDSSGYYLGYCLDRRMSLDKPEVAWRMNTFHTDFISLKNITDTVEHFTLPEDVAFFTVRKKDRLPAYQLTSVLDDLKYGVDLIVRGKDLFNSSLAQQVLASGLGEAGFSETVFHHHPLIKGTGNQKLSKSEGATSIQYLRKEGKKKEDIYGILGKNMGEKEPIQDFEGFQSLINEQKK